MAEHTRRGASAEASARQDTRHRATASTGNIRFTEMLVVWVAVLAFVHLVHSLAGDLSNSTSDKTLPAVANYSIPEGDAIVFSEGDAEEGELSSQLLMLHTQALPRACHLHSGPSHGLLRRTVELRRVTQDNIPTLQGSSSTSSLTRVLDAALDAVEKVVRQHLSHCLLVLGPTVSDDLGLLEGLLKKVMNQSLVPTLVVGPRPSRSTTGRLSLRCSRFQVVVCSS